MLNGDQGRLRGDPVPASRKTTSAVLTDPQYSWEHELLLSIEIVSITSAGSRRCQLAAVCFELAPTVTE